LGDNNGYINKSGDVVIEAKYKECNDFFNGLAKVKTLIDYNEYLINKADEIIWEYQ
ncbi:MAG: WG repeat-containing protein, partial [Spirochaetales bacterium]|nr:WG repeat-containing protein [Spirochaetales bacterium]